MRNVHANRHLVRGMVLGFMSLGACAAAAVDQTYPVYQLRQAPDLSVKAYEEAVWANVPWATGFYRLSTSRKVDLQTHFKIGFTRDALYFLVKCDEPQMDKIKAHGKDGNSALWREDGIEVFVHFKGGKHVFQVLTNAAGARTNMLNTLDMFNATDLSKSAAGAFRNEDRFWVSVKIPFASVRDTPPADGEVWKFNVLRNRMIHGPEGDDRISTYSNLMRSALEPDRFQKLRFHHRAATASDGKRVYDNPTDDDTGAHQIVNLSFNEGAGEVANAQGAILNHGDMKAAGWSGDGKIGHCAELTKEGDFITVAHSPSLGSTRSELTIDLWAYFDLDKLQGTHATLVTKTPGGGLGFGYMLEYADIAPKAQALGFYLAENWQKRNHHVFNNAITTSGWHHIVATFSAKTMKSVLFVDGAKVGAQDSYIEKIAPGTNALTIGAMERDHKDSTRVSTFRGRLDEVKIWSKALTAKDVQNLYGHMFVKSAPVSPPHLATVDDARPTLSWTAAKDGTAAILELSSTPSIVEGKTFRAKMAANEYRPDKPLSPGVWYWRIFSTDGDGKPTSGTKTQAFIVADADEQQTFTQADTTPPVITGVRPFAFNTASGDRPTIRASWSDNQALDLSTARLYLDDQNVTAKAKITPQGAEYQPDKALSRGGHTLRIEIRDRAGNNANRMKHFFAVGEGARTHVELKDRRIYVNREPFFPVIFYHPYAGNTLEQMADWGFNVIHFAYQPAFYASRYKLKDHGRAANMYCDEASRFGQMLFPDFKGHYTHGSSSVVDLSEMLKALRGHPAILALTLDEPNGHPEGAQWAKDLHSTARAAGETKPIIYCLNSPSAASVYAREGMGDGVMNSTYPYPSQPGLLAAKYTDVSREQVNNLKPVWMYGQACDLSSPRGGRTIDKMSKAERAELDSGKLVSTVPPGGVRCMMYLALVHEATGLGWWIHHPGYVGHGGYFPRMKKEVIDCTSEVRHLAPMLLAPDVPVQVAIEPADLGLHLKAKTYDGRTYIIAVNPHEELPVACRFTLPDGKAFRRVDVLFEDRAFTPRGKATSFDDLFAPRQVHVYRIEGGVE